MIKFLLDTASFSSRNLDRKSTRLNSSHTVISYAVFCLKKKKNDRDVERSDAWPIRLRLGRCPSVTRCNSRLKSIRNQRASDSLSTPHSTESRTNEHAI